MQFAQLASVRHRVHLGAPLPFGVRDADQTLLLARGQLLQSADELESLFARGALVDVAELQSARDEILKAPRQQLPQLWSRCLHRVAETLLATPDQRFAGALDDAAQPLQLLIERDPDLAIFQVMRQGGDEDVAYGARRSLQTAVTSFLVAQRLGWEPSQLERAFKVALTMNLSMLALQGQLARAQTAPTAEQRSALQTHPMRSVRMLEQAGIADADWLQAVLRHHEQEDGSGYPAGCTDVGELASLARRADAYTAKLAGRCSRNALAADVAGRQMFMQDPGHPMTAALVKEFGIYPPGCHVRLVSGALAIVVARGPSITQPVLACLTNARGAALAAPERVAAAVGDHAIAGVVGEGSVDLRLPLDRLAALITA